MIHVDSSTARVEQGYLNMPNDTQLVYNQQTKKPEALMQRPLLRFCSSPSNGKHLLDGIPFSGQAAFSPSSNRHYGESEIKTEETRTVEGRGSRRACISSMRGTGYPSMSRYVFADTADARSSSLSDHPINATGPVCWKINRQ
jgi:hypothetical protein